MILILITAIFRNGHQVAGRRSARGRRRTSVVVLSRHRCRRHHRHPPVNEDATRQFFTCYAMPCACVSTRVRLMRLKRHNDYVQLLTITRTAKTVITRH